MRLPKVHEAHPILRGLIRVVTGRPAPGVIRTLAYRSKFFGSPIGKLTQRVMRGKSAWTPGERELMGAFVSSLNLCPF